MTIHLMLTVDLNGNVSPEARNKFYEVIESRGFIRRKLTTIWTVSFQPGATKGSAVKYAKESVTMAATASGVRNYEAAVMPSDEAPTEWKSMYPATTLLGG